MEINNIINLLNSGKLPQGSKTKLFDNQSFETLLQGLQILTKGKFDAGELQNKGVSTLLKKPELEQLSSLIGTAHAQNLQEIKDGDTNKITIQGSKVLADIIYGFVNADISSENINTFLEKKLPASESILNEDLLMENEDTNGKTKDSKKKDEISLLQNVISNFINESVVNPQNINLVNSVPQDDNAANSKIKVLSHEIVQQFLFDKQNVKAYNSAASNVINNIALKSSDILELGNMEQVKLGEDLQSILQFHSLSNEVRTPIQVEKNKDNSDSLNFLQSRKFALGLDENIVYGPDNLKDTSVNGTPDNANLIGNVQKAMFGQKQIRNKDIINGIIKMANADQLSNNEALNGTKVETAKSQDNSSNNSTSEVLSWYIDKVNGKIPKITQSGTMKPYIEIDPPIKDANLPEGSERKLDAALKQRPENRIEQKVQQGDFNFKEAFMKMPEDKVKIKVQEFLGNVNALISDVDEKNLDKVASADSIPKLTSEINKVKSSEKYAETKLENSETKLKSADVKIEAAVNNELVGRKEKEKYSVNVKLEANLRHNPKNSFDGPKSQETLLRSTADRQEIVETIPETTIIHEPKDIAAMNKKSVDVNPDTNFIERLGDKIQDYNLQALTKNKVEGFEENKPKERTAPHRNYDIASTGEKSLANSNVTNASLNDIKNNKNVSEIISNNSQLNSHEIKQENKIKNNSVHEDNVLKNILDGSNSGKSKEHLNNNVNTFMTQFNTLNGNEATNKINEPVVRKDSITSDLLKSVKYMEAQNIKELTVKVAPKELGELTIKLTVENGIMRANITTNNESTLHIINSHLPEINQKLVDQNMQIQSFSVGISNNDMSYFNQNNQGNSGQQQNPQKTVYNYDNQEKDLGIEEITLSTNKVDVLA